MKLLGKCFVFVTIILSAILFLRLALPVKAADPIYVYDIEDLFTNLNDSNKNLYYDQIFALTSIQTLVNRVSPKIFFYYEVKKQWISEPGRDSKFFDKFWFNEFCGEQSGICTKGKLSGRPVIHYSVATTPVIDFIHIFISSAKGVVAWDPRVPATSNLAANLVGPENAIGVRYDTNAGSLYQVLTTTYQLPIIKNFYSLNFSDTSRIPETTLVSTGSSKNNVYRWLFEKYVITRKLNIEYIAYYLDAFALNTIPASDENIFDMFTEARDFIMSKNGIMLDLNTRDSYTVDDPNHQGLDVETWKLFLQYSKDNNIGKSTRIYGFIPWYVKYSDRSLNDALDAEGATQTLFAQYGAMSVTTDTGALPRITNRSFYVGISDQKNIPLNGETNPYNVSKRCDNNKKYILWEFGDYDAPGNIYGLFPYFWRQDPTRGLYPISWMINTEIFESFPILADWLNANKTRNDFFMGEMGAGYTYPNIYPKLEEFTRDSAWGYQKYNIKSTGLVVGERDIITLNGSSNNAYYRFSRNGYTRHNTIFASDNYALYYNMPNGMYSTQVGPFATDANSLKDKVISASNSTRYISIRVIFSAPSLVANTMSALDSSFEAVDPQTFFYLLRSCKLGGNNDDQITYLSSTMPTTVMPGDPVPVNIKVRNDGWNNWTKGNYVGGFAVSDHHVSPANRLVNSGEPETKTSYEANLVQLTKNQIIPGDTDTVSFTISAPTTPGTYYLLVDMKSPNTGWFEKNGSLPWQQQFTVSDAYIGPPPLPNKYDLNGDGKVDILDLARIINARTQTEILNYQGREDVTGDNILNADDLTDFLANFKHL